MQRLAQLLFALLFVAPALAEGSTPAPQDADPIPVLIVTGANNHDWEWTSPSLKEILEESGRFKVSMTREPGEDLADPDTLGRYRAVVLDYNGPRWGEQAEANFMAAVRRGLGVSVIHAANNSFPGWTEYESLVALNWREGTGHGRFHAFDVTIEDRDHPITRTLPQLVQHPDELYHRLVHLHDAPYRQLAGAYSDPKTGGTGAVEPMILVTQVGAGRVFHTPLGHVWRNVEPSRASHADPQFRTLVVRGTEWAATGEVSDGQAKANQLSDEQVASGWTQLFNGKDLEGWRPYNKAAELKGWTVINGCLVRSAKASDIVSTKDYGDFELEFEFQLAAGTNSGVKYRVDTSRMSPLGPEFQVQDDVRFPKLPAKHKTAALYDVFPAADPVLRAPGLWNQGRIVAHGDRIEHWLNGKRVMSAAVGSKAWKAALAKSKFKGHPNTFAMGTGPILLQEHGGEVWYRSLRLRELAPLKEREVQLLDPEGGLSGWLETGDAAYTREGNTVTGAVDGGGQSFLRTEQRFGDFVFETDVKLDVPGNSGIQFRSQINDKQRVYGYQAEIDPSKRAWSGGIYYETGPWLDNLEEDETARKAFKLDGWNTYRIRCVGSHLQVWVNGVQTADLMDEKHAEGFIAFQVHSGKQGVIHWRNPRLWVLE